MHWTGPRRLGGVGLPLTRLRRSETLHIDNGIKGNHTAEMLLLVLLTACHPIPEPPPTEEETGGDTGEEVIPIQTTWDCDNLPGRPLAQEDFPGHANEDITMDAQGYIVGADRFRNLWRTDVDGHTTLIIPDTGVNAGLRLMWWNGKLASASYVTDAIWEIDPETGATELMVGGLSTPSGIEIGADRALWFGELNGNRVQRYHPESDTLTLITDQLLRPNGLTFNNAYDRLYVAATEEGHIYAIDIDPDTSEVIGEPWIFVANAGNGIDGLSVDACDNLYAGWWAEARIERWKPDGSGYELLVDKPVRDFALGNWVWGNADFGWNPTSIFAVKFGDAQIRRFELGVGEKSRPGPLAP